MRGFFAFSLLLAEFCANDALAQQPGRARPARQAAVTREQVDPGLWRVLQEWSEKSAGIDRLEGEILRRKYDVTFGVERRSEGYFYYEAPDKGRLDLNAVTIDPQMLAARNAPGAKVKRKGGKPYQLESDQPEKWVCDGQRIISLDVEEKTAMVHKLPEELRGKNIMNGPLPFLFGLPPLEAVNRFELELTREPTRKDPHAWLKAIPKRPDDAREWRQADVILDTRTGLPAYVRLIKPAGTSEEGYRFSSLKVNSRVGKIKEFFGKDPFRVDLRGYQVDAPDAGAPVMPDLAGMYYKQAEAALARLGIPAEKIDKFRGNPAKNQADQNRIRRQKPQAGSPMNPETRIALEFWTTVK